MTRNRVAFLALSLVLTLPLLGGALWSAVVRNGPDDGGDSLYKYLAMFSEVFGLVRSDYVDPTDAGTLLSGAMEGATDALDPFAIFVPREAAATFDKALAVGRSLSGLTVVRDHGVAYVLAVEAGSPGAAAGFESGDILADVDGHETHEMPRWQLELRRRRGGAGAAAGRAARRPGRAEAAGGSALDRRRPGADRLPGGEALRRGRPGDAGGALPHRGELPR
jgi:carboxyl-terminal processing protease